MDHNAQAAPGVHCLNIRHKGMFVTSVRPDEFTFYDQYDSRRTGAPETSAGLAPTARRCGPDYMSATVVSIDGRAWPSAIQPSS
jgi:hypothetical protein